MSEIPPDARPPPTPPPGAGKTGWTGGRVVAVVLGSIAALIGIALLLGGAALIGAHASARDLGSDAADVVPKDVLGRIRIRAERPGGRPVFVGIGPEREVDAYLRGVAHAEVDDLDPPRYRNSRGGAPRRPPSAERFWVASTEGSGRQAVSWEVEGGQWTIVAMNADATRRVVLDADVGAKVGWFLGVGIGLVVVGLLLLAGGMTLIVVAGRRASRAHAPPSSSASPPR
jgi:hypothetical protein